MTRKRDALMAVALIAALPLTAVPLAQDPSPKVDQDPAPVQPDTPAPTQAPPPPPSKVPEPPTKPAKPAPKQESQGQWVYTDQYGWVWMPYGDGYTRTPVDGDAPLMYLYYPAMGWCWVEAPWIWGWGPMPFFGFYGTVHFGWWGHGYGHWYGFRDHYSRPYYGGRGSRPSGGAMHGSRPSAPAKGRMGR